MGLDMYLFKRKKNSSEPLDNEIAYWRKANAIRQWIVTHTGYSDDGDCEEWSLTKENLVELKNDCLTVLKHPELASEILPTSSGFFFGCTDYDEWYFEVLKDTVGKINFALDYTDFDDEEIIYYEWW